MQKSSLSSCWLRLIAGLGSSWGGGGGGVGVGGVSLVEATGVQPAEEPRPFH